MSIPLDVFVAAAKEAGHSDAYIDECVAYIQFMEGRGYVPIFSIVHLSILIGVKSTIIGSFILDREKRYSYFKLLKRRGGFREIMAPNQDLKYIQRWLLFNILNKYPLEDSCHSFRENYSTSTNAETHARAGYVLKVDLLRFYDCITESRVRGLFKTMGYPSNLSSYLSKLVTAHHRDEYWENFEGEAQSKLFDLVQSRPAILPQGAPTSPMISNIIASKLDKRLSGHGDVIGYNYSRYADDLTFSSEYEECLPDLDFLNFIVEEEGFFINDAKTIYSKKGMKQYVTGYTITHDVHVSKKYRKNIFSHLYYAKKYGPQNHLKERAKRNGDKRVSYGFQDWLLGSISYVMSVDKINGIRMMREYNKIDWTQ